MISNCVTIECQGSETRPYFSDPKNEIIAQTSIGIKGDL
jgi:hypothetical protein